MINFLDLALSADEFDLIPELPVCDSVLHPLPRVLPAGLSGDGVEVDLGDDLGDVAAAVDLHGVARGQAVLGRARHQVGRAGLERERETHKSE